MKAKEEYNIFCHTTYVPVYSKPWWLDAVCGKDNWDVWIYKTGDEIAAAMPYYTENRGNYKYITKAPMTQNNGIIFKHEKGTHLIREAERQEKIINAACDFISSLRLDVYEQQFHYSFTNWQPFYWNNYTSALRYTYVIDDTDPENVWNNMASNCRKNIKKGRRLTYITDNLTRHEFYQEYSNVFTRKNMPVPITEAFWERLYSACTDNQSGKMLCARDSSGNIHAILFLVWDEESMYLLLGGYSQEYSWSQAYSALIYHTICMAGAENKKYDFEGSMIKNVAKAFRQFGGQPLPYFRIRKVFNYNIMRMEAEHDWRNSTKG